MILEFSEFKNEPDIGFFHNLRIDIFHLNIGGNPIPD